uniref:Ig-like domain-containing protein n=1 Tax=Cannabis sativa TaxID=3483 RepID=A0A803NKK9_CANSA
MLAIKVTWKIHPILSGGLDQESLLRALRLIRQYRKLIYKLHGTSLFKEEVRQARLSKGFKFSESFNIKGGPHVGGDSKKAQERYIKEAKKKLLTNVNNISERLEKLFKECDDITFMESDVRWVHHPHADALVVVDNIGGDNVHQILVDNGTSINLLNPQAFKHMGLHKKDLRPVTSSIYSFTEDIIELKGIIKLPIMLGTTPVTTKSMADFIVIDRGIRSGGVRFGKLENRDVRNRLPNFEGDENSHLNLPAHYEIPYPRKYGSVQRASPPRHESFRTEKVPHVEKLNLDPRILDYTNTAQAVEETIEILTCEEYDRSVAKWTPRAAWVKVNASTLLQVAHASKDSPNALLSTSSKSLAVKGIVSLPNLAASHFCRASMSTINPVGMVAKRPSKVLALFTVESMLALFCKILLSSSCHFSKAFSASPALCIVARYGEQSS